jgi:hypothetical protein
MGCSSAWKNFLSTATVIGAGLFSVAASATTLTPLPTTFDATAGTMTIGISIAGNSPTGIVSFSQFGHLEPLGPSVPVVNGVARITFPQLGAGAHEFFVIYGGDSANPAESLHLVAVVPVNWLSAVLEDVLSD